MIKCSAPFCAKKFHLNCVGLKGKSKEELCKLYFVCLSCNEFISYSNSKLDFKLSTIETELNSTIRVIKDNIQSLEKTTSDLKLRLNSFEQSVEDNKINNENINLTVRAINTKITGIESDFNTSISSLSHRIDELKKEMEGQVIEKREAIKPAPCKPPIVTSEANTKIQIRIMGVKEAPEEMKFIERFEYECTYVKRILSHLNENNINITDCFRLGKFKKDAHRPRTLLVTLTSIWDKRKILSKATLLSTFGENIFISPALSPSEINIEKKILKKRWQLISDGTDRKQIKIKNLKLFVNEKEINIENE